MTRSRINDVAEFVLDGTHASPVRTDHGVPVLSAQNVKNGKLSFETARYTSVAEHDHFARRVPLKSGDVLLTIVGTIGRAAVLDEVRPLVFQRSVAVIRPKPDRLLARFLFHVTQSPGFQAQLARAQNQSSQAGVYLGKLKELHIPVPPLSDQRRIAEVLDRAEALRAKRRAAFAQVDSLTHSIFLEMFGDPTANPRRWPQKQIADVGTVVTGNTPSRQVPEYYGNDIEWIKSDNINTPHYYLTRADEGLSSFGRQVARVVSAGSILVTCIAGSPECIGNAAMTDRDVAFNQQINALVPFDGNAHFIYAQFRFGKRLVQQASTASMKGMVNKSRFERVLLIWPPMSLQEAFADRVRAAESLANDQRESLDSLDALFASLQHRAFRGEL